MHKVPNKKTPHTTACGCPALLINKGVCGTLCVQTVLDEIPFIDCVVPVLGMPAKCPFLRHDLGVIGVAQGDKKTQNPPPSFPRDRKGLHRGIYELKLVIHTRNAGIHFYKQSKVTGFRVKHGMTRFVRFFRELKVAFIWF